MSYTNAQSVINALSQCITECNCSGKIINGIISYDDYKSIVSFLKNNGFTEISVLPNNMFTNKSQKYLIVVIFNYYNQDMYIIAQAVKTNCS